MASRLTNKDLQDVVALIPSAQHGGSLISAPEVAYRLGLTLGQVYYRIRRLRRRDIIITIGGNPDRVPLLSNQRGYILSTDPIDNAQFRRRRSQTALTIFRLTYNEAIDRFIATLPLAEQPAMRRKLVRSWVRIMEDIADVVAANNAVLAAATI